MKRWWMIGALGLVGFGWLAWRGHVAPQATMAGSPAPAMLAPSAEAPLAHAQDKAPVALLQPEGATPQLPQVRRPAMVAKGATRVPLTWPKLLSPPTAEGLRAERRRHPHTASASYARYAAHWAQCMQTVGSDSTRAYDVFAHAEACVERAPAPPVEVQALCLRHAQHLAEAFSELTPRYHRLRSHADAGALALVDAPVR